MLSPMCSYSTQSDTTLRSGWTCKWSNKVGKGKFVPVLN